MYPPLADLMTWKSQRGVNAIGIATVKWPPRAPERGFDWSTYLMLYDPTEIDSGRELRFYGAEANMPRIKDGDVFLVRQLNVSADAVIPLGTLLTRAVADDHSGEAT